jgi:hypothetical protein
LGQEGDNAAEQGTGAQFEISIDGKPRSYRDLNAVAIEGAEYLKGKFPNSEVVVKDLRSGEGSEVKIQVRLGPHGKK